MKTFIYCAMVSVLVPQCSEHCERSQNMHNFNENVDRSFKESTQDLGDGIPRPLVDVTPPPTKKVMHLRASQGAQQCEPRRGSEKYAGDVCLRL